MGVWSSIYRVRDISLCDDYSIKLIAKDGREVKLENPIEIKEEVYGSKNITPIHEWFVRFARERLGITGDELVNDSYSADIPLDLDDLVELVDTINKVLKKPELGKKLLPYPKWESGRLWDIDGEPASHLDDRRYDDSYIQELYYVGYFLQKIIDEHHNLECVEGYIYDAA